VNAKTRFGLITLGAVLACGLTLSLGNWQLSRAAQKQAVHAQMQAQGTKAVLDVQAVVTATDPTALVHQSARLQGTWMADKTVYLDNRQMDARVGFFVLTPLLLERARTVILVQRGWVPRNFEDRSRLPRVETPMGTVTVQGRIAPWPSKLYELGGSSGGAIRQNLDLAQFKTETALPLLGVTLQQTDAASEGLLRNWPVVTTGVDKHYGYAFQWFGLSALIAVLYLWFQIVRRFIFRPKGASTHV